MQLDDQARRSLPWLLVLDGVLIIAAIAAVASVRIFTGSLLLVLAAGLSVYWFMQSEKRLQDEQEALVRKEKERAAALARQAAMKAEKAERELAEKRDELFRLAGLADMDTMTQVQFKNWVAAVLRGCGFVVAPVTDQDHIGVDLVGESNGERIAVQCRRQTEPVGAGAVEQVATVAPKIGCSQAMVACSTTFTDSALVLAKAHHCILADRVRLEELVQNPEAKVQAH